MANQCPVCRAPLWRRPFARRLRCPRCGAEFRPTVPLALFQVLLAVLLVVGLGLALVLSRPYAWLLLLVLLVSGFLTWLLPRMVRLEVETPGLRVAAGPAEGGELRPDWPAEEPEPIRGGHLVLVAGILAAVVLVWLLLRLVLA